MPLAADIDRALAGVDCAIAATATLNEAGIEAMFAQIAAFVKLAGGGWDASHRQEFIDQASVDLAEIPASLLAPALVEARRRVAWAREFVPWIFSYVEPAWARLKVEHERLSALSAISREI